MQLSAWAGLRSKQLAAHAPAGRAAWPAAVAASTADNCTQRQRDVFLTTARIVLGRNDRERDGQRLSPRQRNGVFKGVLRRVRESGVVGLRRAGSTACPYVAAVGRYHATTCMPCAIPPGHYDGVDRRLALSGWLRFDSLDFQTSTKGRACFCPLPVGSERASAAAPQVQDGYTDNKLTCLTSAGPSTDATVQLRYASDRASLCFSGPSTRARMLTTT